MENEIQPNISPIQPLPRTPAPILVSPTTNWSKNLLFIVLGLVIITGSVFIGIQSSANTTQGVKFTGNITETNNGCWSDGICSIKIDDKWIVAEIGGLRSPNSKPEIRGNLIGINFSQDTNKYIGKRTEVYAKQTDNNNFTIYGNESYYIKLLE